MNHFKRFCDDEAGNATEYALILGLVSIAIMVGATLLGGALGALFQRVLNLLPW